MSKKNEKLIKLAKLLRECESSGSKITPEILAKKTDYTLSTIKTHYSKKLKNHFLFAGNKGKWSVRGMLQISNDDFISFMRQTNKTEVESEEQQFTKLLIRKSRDSFIVALESYNRPSLENRVEVFCILVVNAWELLLKSQLVTKENRRAIYRTDGKTLSISECVTKIFPEKEPIRKNLEQLIILRDKATHLLLPEIQSSLSRLFQSTVMNYIDTYRALTGISPIAGQSTGLLSLVVDGADADHVVLKMQYGEEIANEVSEFLKQHTKQTKILNSSAYTIPIEYRLTLTKSANDSDLTLGTGTTGKSAMIINRAKDPSVTHPHGFNEVIVKINKILKDKVITSHKLQAIFYKHKIKSKEDFHFQFRNVHTYSDSFIEWLLKNLKQLTWLDSALESYKNKPKK